MKNEVLNFNTKELARMLEDKEINFVGECGSVLQMIGINSAIMYLESLGKTVKGVVLLQVTDTISQNDYSANYFLKREGLDYVYINGQVDYTRKTEKIAVFLRAMKMKNNSEPIYLVGANLIHSLYYALSISSRRVVYIEIDDGIENYFNRHQEFLILDLSKNRNIFKVPLIYIKRLLSDLSYNGMLKLVKKKNNYIDCLLLYREDGLRNCNEAIKDNFLNILEKNSKRIDYNNVKCMEDAILVIGNGADDFNILKKIVDVFKDERVVFKPHPREKNLEKYSEFDCVVYKDGRFAIENVLAKMKKPPRCVVGDYSTVLVTSRLLFGVKTISFSQLYDRGKYEMRLVELYKKTFYRWVDFPENEKALLDMIEGLKAG